MGESNIFPKKGVSFAPPVPTPYLRPRACARCTAHSTEPDLLKLELFNSSGIDSNQSFRYIDPPEVMESSQNRIDSRPADIANSTRLSTTSNSAVGVRVCFFALTLNPMGKRRCLESSDYAGGYAAKAKCSVEQIEPFALQAEFRYRVSFTAGLLSSSPQKQA